MKTYSGPSVCLHTLDTSQITAGRSQEVDSRKRQVLLFITTHKQGERERVRESYLTEVLLGFPVTY